MPTMRLLLPEGTTNYIKNPSARYDTTGWAADGSTITRTLDYARFGVSSLKIVTNGAALHEGAYYRVSALENISEAIAVSIYVRGTGAVRLRLVDNPFGKEYASDLLELRSDRWQRLEVVGRSSGSNDVRLYIETYGDAAQAITLYADCAQMERKAFATTYCDGDQEGCQWNGMYHSSTSFRDPYTRAGGRWVTISGRDREQEGLYATVVGGMGVAPLTNNLQSYAVSPGSYYQNTKILNRVITITFHAKHYNMQPDCNDSLERLNQLRQMLIDAVKPDRTAGGEAFTLEYQDGDRPLYIKVRYDGGLEGEWDVRNQWINSFPLRLLAVSPLFTEDDQEADTLDFQSTQTINYILQRKDGEWSEMNGGFDGQVLGIVIGPQGEIIAFGDFTHANNDVNAIDPMIFANCIAYWDGEKWNAYGSGANGIIRAAAVAPNGYLYVAGEFTSIGGVAANRVAYWDGSSWNAMGTGLNGIGYALDIAPDGRVYIGGDFTAADGIPAYYAVSYFEGTYGVLGSNSGLNGIVYSISISPDGTEIILGGEFTDEYSDPGILSLNYVALYWPTSFQFYDLGVGFDNYVYKVLYIPSGIVYAVGSFTQSNDTALTLLYIAYWNGAGWFPVGIGTDDIIRDMAISALGNIVIAGDFIRSGGEDTKYLALWNGSTYVNLDVELNNAAYAVAMDSKENIFVAPNGTLASFASITTVNNLGTAEASPIIFIEGPCTLRWLENQTSRKRLYMDLDIAENEEITIDFAQGRIDSNVRGDIAYTVIPGSDMRAWTLIPGENKIASLMVDDVLATVHIYYTPRHWSVDATARIESF